MTFERNFKNSLEITRERNYTSWGGILPFRGLPLPIDTGCLEKMGNLGDDVLSRGDKEGGISLIGLQV